MGSPFEWLRSVARSRRDDDQLGVEAASALSALTHDPAQLMVACRRLLDHHRSNGSLWWLASHLLAAPDATAAARRCHDLFANDRTASRLRDALPLFDDGNRLASVGWTATIAEALDERFDIDAVAIVPEDNHYARRRARDRAALIDAWELDGSQATMLLVSVHAASPQRLLVATDTRDALLEAPDTEVWAVMPTGTLLSPRLFDAVVAANQRDESLCVIDFGRISSVVSSRAVDTPADLASRLDCPNAPELLRPL